MDKLNIQWYPGHMTKTRREIEACLKEVDMVAEITDARIPMSSRNPDIDRIAGAKPRLLVLNKADLAQVAATQRWADYFRSLGYGVVTTDCKSGGGVENFKTAAKTLLAEKLERNREKGVNKAIRVMVCGIPNVGKSAFINRMAGGHRVKEEDRPGVTRGRQWIAVDRELELMDTPGVLWPKFNDDEVALRLALTGAIKDNVLDVADLALRLISILKEDEPQAFVARYGVECEGEPLEIFENICRRRGMLMRGGDYDYERCAAMLLDELRGGKIGRITLELPPVKQK